MEIERDDTGKRIYVWLTRAEYADETLQARLKPLYAQWKKEKYLVAVFHSGTQDLQSCTLDLLLHNQKVLARQDLEREKKKTHTPRKESALEM